MKIMNVLRIIFVSVAVVALQMGLIADGSKKERQHATTSKKGSNRRQKGSAVEPVVSSEDAIDTARKELEDAMIEAEKFIIAAERIINQAYGQWRNSGEITSDEYAKIVGEQKNNIALAKQRLEKAVETSVKTVEQADLMSRFAVGAKRFGAAPLAPLQAGYWSTQDEKLLARARIIELEQQKADIIAGIRQMKVNKQDSQIIQDLNNEIYQQKIITGDAWSLQRKLFWGTVALAGVGLTYQCLGAPTMAPVIAGEDWLAEQKEYLNRMEQASIAAQMETYRADEAKLRPEIKKLKEEYDAIKVAKPGPWWGEDANKLVRLHREIDDRYAILENQHRKLWDLGIRDLAEIEEVPALTIEQVTAPVLTEPETVPAQVEQIRMPAFSEEMEKYPQGELAGMVEGEVYKAEAEKNAREAEETSSSQVEKPLEQMPIYTVLQEIKRVCESEEKSAGKEFNEQLLKETGGRARFGAGFGKSPGVVVDARKITESDRKKINELYTAYQLRIKRLRQIATEAMGEALDEYNQWGKYEKL